METHCIYGSDDCTKCKVAPEEGLRRETLREDFILLLDEFMVFLETEEGENYAANFVSFIRWINK